MSSRSPGLMLRSGLALSGQPQASSRSRPGGLAAKSQSEYEAEGQEKQLYGPADDVAADLPALKPGDQGFQINMAACIRAYKKKKAESESLKAQIKKKKGECSKLTSSARPRKKQEIAALQEKLEELEAEVSLLGQRIGPVREAFDNQDKFKEREERRQRDKDLLKMKHRSISVSSGDESAAPSSRYSVSLGPNPSPSQSPVAPSGSPGLLTEIKGLESPTLRPQKLVFSADEIEDIDPKEKVKARKSVKAKETSLFVFAEEDFPVLPAPATQGAPPGKPVTSVTVGALSASAPRAPCSLASGSPPCVSGMETGKCVSKPSYLAESSGKGIIACTVIPSVLSHPALYTQVPTTPSIPSSPTDTGKSKTLGFCGKIMPGKSLPTSPMIPSGSFEATENSAICPPGIIACTVIPSVLSHPAMYTEVPTTPSIPSSPTDTGKSKTVSFGGKIKPGEFLPTSPMIPSDSFEATENSAICTHNNIPRTVVPSVLSHQDAAQYTKVPTTPIIPSEAVNSAGTVFDQFEDAVDIREVSGRKEACFSSVPTTPIILSCSVIKTVEGQFEDAAPIIISSPAAGTVSRRSGGVISTVEGELCDRQLRNILTTTPMIPCGVSDLVAIQKDTETRGRGTVKNTFTKKSVTLVGSGEVVGKAPPNVNPTALSLSPEQGHRSVLYPQVIIIKAKQPPANEGAPKAPVNVVSVADGSAVRSVGGMAVPVPEMPGISVPNTVPVRSVGLNPVGGMAAGVGEPVPEVPAEPGITVPNTVPVRSVGLNPVGGMAAGVGEPVPEVPAEPGVSVPNTVPVRSVGLNPVGGMAVPVSEVPGISVPNTVPVRSVGGMAVTVPEVPGISVPNTVPVRSVGGMAVTVPEVPGISVPNTVPVRSVGLNPVGGMAAGVGEPVPEVPAEPGITVPNTVPVNAVSGSVGDSMVRERLTPGTSQRSFANVTSTGSFSSRGPVNSSVRTAAGGPPALPGPLAGPGPSSSGGGMGGYSSDAARRKNAVKLQWISEGPPPGRDTVIDRVLELGFVAEDFHMFVHNTVFRDYTISFVRLQDLDTFWANYRKAEAEGKWVGFKTIVVSRPGIVKVTILVDNESIPPADLRVWLKRYGEVLGGVQKDLDGRGIWSGGWHVRFRLRTVGNVTQHIPSSAYIGKDRVYCFYPGQPRQCWKCGSSRHFSMDCDKLKCALCLGFGHMAKGCPKSIRCNLCGELGHAYCKCPMSWQSIEDEFLEEMGHPDYATPPAQQAPVRTITTTPSVPQGTTGPPMCRSTQSANVVSLLAASSTPCPSPPSSSLHHQSSSSHPSPPPRQSSSHTSLPPRQSSSHPSLLPRQSSSHPSLLPRQSSSHPSLPPRQSSSHPSLPPRQSSSHLSLPPRQSSSHPSLPPRQSSSHPSLPPRQSSSHPSLPPRQSSSLRPSSPLVLPLLFTHLPPLSFLSSSPIFPPSSFLSSSPIFPPSSFLSSSPIFPPSSFLSSLPILTLSLYSKCSEGRGLV
uniref:CCHC-type domain-containing protein n=1 Tax=Xenopus tropicalis TaxID=8364 RepID=A0A803K5L1_XENTR